MVPIKGHHIYYLENFEDPGRHMQSLRFIEKVQDENGNLVTVADGTTNEDVIKMLVHRLKAMNERNPCRENSLAVTKLEEALHWLEHRTADRRARGVEGTGRP